MISVSEFLSDISMSIGNVHDGIIERAVTGAAIEFCDRTGIWQDDLDPFVIQPNVAEYPLSFDTTQKVLIVLTEVAIDGHEVFPTTLTDLRGQQTHWQTLKTARPTHYFLPEPRVIRFFRAPNEIATGDVVLTGRFKPTRKARHIPHVLYDGYYDAIVNGALGRLHSMKGRAWYSPADASESKRIFNEQADIAKIRVSRSGTTATPRTRIRGAA